MPSGVCCEGHQSGGVVSHCNGCPRHAPHAPHHEEGGENEGLQAFPQPAPASGSVWCVPHPHGALGLLHLRPEMVRRAGLTIAEYLLFPLISIAWIRRSLRQNISVMFYGTPRRKFGFHQCKHHKKSHQQTLQTFALFFNFILFFFFNWAVSLSVHWKRKFIIGCNLCVCTVDMDGKENFCWALKEWHSDIMK